MIRRNRLIEILVVIALSSLAAGVAAAESFSDKITKQLNTARRAEVEQNYKEAVTIYEGALAQLVPEGSDRRVVLKLRASIYEHISQFEKAEADLTEVLRITPVDPNLYLDRGYFYMRRGRYSDAIADFTAGGRVEPRRPVYTFAIGRAQIAMGEFEKAVASYTEALRLDPEDGRALLARAEAKVRLARYEDAKTDYTRALRSALRQPTDRYYAFLGRGYAQLMLRDFEAAVTDLDAALALEPNAFNALSWRGYANEQRGRNDLAIADYERAAAYDPTDLKARASLQRARSK